MNTKGFSIIELMVGILVALLSSLAIINTSTMISQQKQISSGTNQTLDNLILISQNITSDARMAGLATTFNGRFFCKTINENGTDVFPAPIEVTEDNTTLVLTVRYADSPSGIASTTVKNSIAQGGTLDSNSLNYTSDEVSLILTKDADDNCTTVGTAVASSYEIPEASMAIPINEYRSTSYLVSDDVLIERDNVTGDTFEIASDVVYMNVFGLVNGNWVEVKDNNYTNDSLAEQYGQTAPSALKIFFIAREQSIGTSTERAEKCTTEDVITDAIVIDTENNEPTLAIDADSLCNRYQSIEIFIPLINLALGAEAL